MAGRSSAEAVQNYVDPLRRALSCVTNEVLDVGGGYFVQEEPHVAALAGGEAIRLRGPRQLALIATQHYFVVEAEGERGPWKVRTAGYWYELEAQDGREFLAYHWHPRSRSAEERPHLHIRGAERRTHLPTGRIALEDVLRLALTDLDVDSLRGDWQDVLDESQAAFEKWRTWG